jgi:hypothetical protein
MRLNRLARVRNATEQEIGAMTHVQTDTSLQLYIADHVAYVTTQRAHVLQ